MTESAKERALLRWVASVLAPSNIPVTQLSDFKDGVVLIRLAEVLFKETIDPKSYRTSPTRDLEMVLNSECAIKFLQSKDVRLVNTSGRDIFELNPRQLFGLLTTLYFSTQPKTPSKSSGGSGDDPLLEWAQTVVEPRDVKLSNWDSSWSDGRGLYELTSAAHPNLLPVGSGDSLSPAERETRALRALETAGTPVYASPGDIAGPQPNALVVKMQIQEIFNDWPNGSSRRRSQLPRDEVPDRVLGIDLGATRVRYGDYLRDEPNNEYIDNKVSVTPEGRVVAGSPPGSTAIPSALALVGRQYNDPATESLISDRKSVV
jgi:hypothetical protein